MAKTVWKYELPVDDAKHRRPATIVHAEALGMDLLNVWCEVDHDYKLSMADYQVFGTGATIPDQSRYVTTVLVGPFVWHIYEVW